MSDDTDWRWVLLRRSCHAYHRRSHPPTTDPVCVAPAMPGSVLHGVEAHAAAAPAPRLLPLRHPVRDRGPPSQSVAGKFEAQELRLQVRPAAEAVAAETQRPEEVAAAGGEVPEFIQCVGVLYDGVFGVGGVFGGEELLLRCCWWW